jgi:hypothetical protein
MPWRHTGIGKNRVEGMVVHNSALDEVEALQEV